MVGRFADISGVDVILAHPCQVVLPLVVRTSDKPFTV
jgi:hypothetical protein